MSAEFVDTNVLLHAFSQDEPPKRERAQSLLERLWQSGDGRLSTQVLQEFYVTPPASWPTLFLRRRPRRSS